MSMVVCLQHILLGRALLGRSPTWYFKIAMFCHCAVQADLVAVVLPLLFREVEASAQLAQRFAKHLLAWVLVFFLLLGLLVVGRVAFTFFGGLALLGQQRWTPMLRRGNTRLWMCSLIQERMTPSFWLGNLRLPRRLVPRVLGALRSSSAT